MANTAGQLLKEARQTKKLSLEEIAQTTRIRLRFLQALEDDNHTGLPSPAQARGFIRLVCSVLEIPAEPILNAWEGLEAAPPALSVAGEQSSPSITSAPPLDDSVSQSQKIFDEIGNHLRSQREVLSLSMADVERYAHLPQRHLLALEEGRIEDLPSTVQGRGMLANYASFLNLNSEELLLRFADGLQARRAERLEMDPDDLKESAPKRLTFETRIPAFNIKLPPALQKLRRKITADMVIGASLVTILVGFIIWSVAMLASTGISNSTTPPAVADILLSSGTPVAATLGAGETQQATLPPVNGTVLPGNTTLQPTVPSAGSGAIQVYIVSRQRVYMRVTVDGNVKYNARTIPGETYPFSGNSQIEVQANNASGLQIYYNQKDMGILGNMGQLLDITFTKEGATTAVPKPSITPQTTPTPTGGAATTTPQITNTPTALPTAVPTK